MKRNLLRIENWQLNADELIEKKRIVRKKMWMMYIIFCGLWITGSLLWLFTDDIVFSPWLLVMSLIIFMLIVLMKVQEFLLSNLITLKWR